MKNIRIIPRLDIKGPNLVKGIHLEGLRVLGSPEDFAEYYYASGADELLLMDVVASLYERNSLRSIIERTAKKTFIPMTVGGGLRNLNDIKEVLRSGADKVALNTGAIKRPEIISEASSKFGSSTIVVSIEAIKSSDGKYYAFIDNGREFTGIEVVSWAQRVQELGAGEIILTSVDMEGTGRGIDSNLINEVSRAVSIPVIAHGGIGCLNDVLNSMYAGADAIAIASMLHYSFVREFRIIRNEIGEGNKDFLKNGLIKNSFEETSINQIKNVLKVNGFQTRI